MDQEGRLPPRQRADTAEIPGEEIRKRLELGRLAVQPTAEGSMLEWRLETERRVEALPWRGVDRRQGKDLLQLPTRFPEKGPILCLLVGGWADDHALQQPLPFWGDDAGRGFMVWQALQNAGLLHKRDGDFTLGRGGFWDEEPPRTQGLAMTYVGFKRPGELLDFETVIRPWNQLRLQSLVEACHHRSMDRLRVVTLGEVARFMMCGVIYGMSGIPVLSLPDPALPSVEASDWIAYASDVLTAAV